MLDSPLYPRVLFTTFKVAVLITGFCLLIAYPYAYLLCRCGKAARGVLLVAVLLPFWTSVLVRSFAWEMLLQDTGLINEALWAAGVIDDPIPLVRNLTGVVIGMTHVLLPFMVLPIYAAMKRIDPGLVRAAETLGARPARAFHLVYLPLTMPGVVAGVLLVFSLSLGFYITPSLPGGPKDILLGELIVQRFSGQLDLGTGSALGMVLLAATLVVLAAGSRFAKLSDLTDVGR
ncbi:ABC transporter permease [Nonomuraea sp. NPDC049129]|uniref:ABC transporter permease n=1 Tax=Nonomuraea sp. NPDC049129 TaxID=3155272 RepID=UPI003401D1B6